MSLLCLTSVGKCRLILFFLIHELLLCELICQQSGVSFLNRLFLSAPLLPDCCVAMTSEEEEGPSVATPTATAPSAAAFSGVTAAIARGDGNDAVTSSSPRRPSPLRLPRPEEKEEKEEEIEVEGIIQEERIEKEEEECEADDEDGDDDGSSDTSVLVVPYPELVPVVFFCLKQTTCPRSWCIRMVSSPYPLNTVIRSLTNHSAFPRY